MSILYHQILPQLLVCPVVLQPSIHQIDQSMQSLNPTLLFTLEDMSTSLIADPAAGTFFHDVVSI
jgi:hypothetical protein